MKRILHVLKEYFHKRIQVPVINFLNEGTDPKKLALAVALGVTIGIFPIIGVTTVLCSLVAIIFRINMAVIQLVNYFVYPIQLALIIPYLKLGAYLFHVEGLIPITNFTKQFSFADLRSGFSVLTKSFAGAILVWIVIALILGFVIYKIVYPIFKRIAHTSSYYAI